MIWTYYFFYFKCFTHIIIKQSKVKTIHIIKESNVKINEIKLFSVFSLIFIKDNYIFLQMRGLPNPELISINRAWNRRLISLTWNRISSFLYWVFIINRSLFFQIKYLSIKTLVFLKPYGRIKLYLGFTKNHSTVNC